MKKLNLNKLMLSGMLVAVTVSFSGFSIPIGAVRCFPIQHLINIIAAIFLGPMCGVGIAFCTSLIRNMIGTGSLLAFPGSMVGAYLAATLYRHTANLPITYAGEVMGSGVIGGLLCYPVANLLMGKEVVLFVYVIPFLISTLAGTVIAAMLIGILLSTGIFQYLNRLLRQ